MAENDAKEDDGKEHDGKSLFDFMPWKAPPAAAPVGKPEAAEIDPALSEAVLAALRTVFDPEIPVNLVDLGLIYDLVVERSGKVYVEMTVTSPSCPVAEALPGDVERAVRGVAGVTEVRVNLVWTPPWHPDLMTEEAKLELGML